MATPLRMPDLGTVEGTVTLVRWLKAEGDTVTLGEPLFEVETDKGVSEVEAALAGVLLKRLVGEGGRAAAGEPIALIRRPGESDEPAPATDGAGPASAPARSTAPPQRTAVPPVIRALAEKHGVDLSTVTATGPGGRLTREDVLRARGTVRAERPSAPVSGAAPPAGLSLNQTIVARKVSQSHREKPVYHVHAQVDMTRVIEARASSKTTGEEISWDAAFVRACAVALGDEPLFRRYLDGEALREHPGADVAVAIGVEDDLYAPAVRGPGARSVREVSREIAALAEKAGRGGLKPQDAEGSCFLVSNLGMFPIESFDAIVSPEHSAALAAGPAIPTPVSDGKKAWIAPLARLTLTVDHRVINGRTAARFLGRVKQILETGAFV